MRKPPSSRRRSIASCPAMWIAKSSDSDSRRPSAAIASRRANLLIRYVSSRADTRIRDTGYASSWASWSAGAIATRSDAAPRSSASRTRDVPLSPMLGALPVLEPRDVDSRNLHGLAGRGDAHELAGVGARHRPADDDLVAFRDDVIDRRAAVGEGCAQHEEPLLFPFAAGRHSRRGGVVDVVLGRHLVNHADVASVHDFFVKHSRGRFVLLFSHVVLLLKTLASAPRNRLLYNHARTPLVPVREMGRCPETRMSHPKVFGEADDESPDGGTPWVLRGPFPRPRPRDPSGGPRPRPHGTPAGSVSALPRRFAGVGSRRGEWIRRAHDAARARLADDGRNPRPSMAVVPRLRPIPTDRPSILADRGRLGLLPLPPLGQRAGFRARGDPSSDSHRFDPPRHPPPPCARSTLSPCRKAGA